MRTYELRETSGIDSLTLCERPEPRPGLGQVVVRMRAASLNYRDLVVAKGGYGRGIRLPLVPLSDGVGEVVEAGTGVNRVKSGDRVAGIVMQRWISGPLTDVASRSALGGAVDGVLSDYVVFDQEGLVHVPGHLNWEEAACLPCAGVTAWNSLVTSGGVAPGNTVLTLGTGGVSIFAIQIAKLTGARVIATTGSEAKAERLRDLGVQAVINYKTTPDWSKAVREMTSGVGVDHIVEVGGAGTLEQSLRAVRNSGTITLIGVLGGKGEFNPNWLFMKAVRLQGIYVGSREMFEAFNTALSANQVRPVVDRVFAFEEVREAMRYLESGAHFGKVCICF